MNSNWEDWGDKTAMEYSSWQHQIEIQKLSLGRLDIIDAIIPLKQKLENEGRIEATKWAAVAPLAESMHIHREHII
jgi:hypothetical protein